jgi:hypothetical protein
VEGTPILAIKPFDVRSTGAVTLHVKKCTRGYIVNSSMGLSAMFQNRVPSSVLADVVPLSAKPLLSSILFADPPESYCRDERLDVAMAADGLTDDTYKASVRGQTQVLRAVRGRNDLKDILGISADPNAVDECGGLVLQHLTRENNQLDYQDSFFNSADVLERLQHEELEQESNQEPSDHALLQIEHALLQIEERQNDFLYAALVITIIIPPWPMIEAWLRRKFCKRLSCFKASTQRCLMICLLCFIWAWCLYDACAAWFKYGSRAFTLLPDLLSRFCVGCLAYFGSTRTSDKLKDKLLLKEFHLVVVSVSTKVRIERSGMESIESDHVDNLENMMQKYKFASVGYDWKGSSSQGRPIMFDDSQHKADQLQWGNIQHSYREYMQAYGEHKQEHDADAFKSQIEQLKKIRDSLTHTNWYSKYISLIRGACQGELMNGKVVVMACVSGISPIARVERSLMEEIKGTIISDLQVRLAMLDLNQNLIIKLFETYEVLETYLKSVRDNYRASDVSVKDKDFQTYMGEPCVWDEGKFELQEKQHATAGGEVELQEKLQEKQHATAGGELELQEKLQES